MVSVVCGINLLMALDPASECQDCIAKRLHEVSGQFSWFLTVSGSSPCSLFRGWATLIANTGNGLGLAYCHFRVLPTCNSNLHLTSSTTGSKRIKRQTFSEEFLLALDQNTCSAWSKWSFSWFLTVSALRSVLFVDCYLNDVRTFITLRTSTY
jgi:hypothetical protein